MHQQLRLTEEERTNLVAFVDGELDEQEAQKLEDKIARSVSAQKEVAALEKTWSMLDWLPKVEAPADFATATLELIHSRQVRAQSIQERIKQVVVVASKVVGWSACVVGVAVGAFVLVRYAWPDPSRALIEHLDIVENLDSYRAVPDIKFLDDLNRLGLFADPPEPAAQTPAE